MSNTLDFQVSRARPSIVGSRVPGDGLGTGTGIKYFTKLANPSLINSTTFNTVVPPTFVPNTNGTITTPAGTTQLNPAIGLFLPANGQFDGQEFNVICVGTFGSNTGDPSGTVNVQLQVVTGTLASPTFTTIASTGAVTPTFSAAEPFLLDVVLSGDSGTGMLQGAYDALIANVLVNSTHKPLDNLITGLDFVNGNPALQRGAVFGLVVGVSFGTSNNTNTASLTEFAIES